MASHRLVFVMAFASVLFPLEGRETCKDLSSDLFWCDSEWVHCAVWCDGHWDCNDHRDEEDCADFEPRMHTFCHDVEEDYFNCDGVWVACKLGLYCNGHQDCSDNVDEWNCYGFHDKGFCLVSSPFFGDTFLFPDLFPVL